MVRVTRSIFKIIGTAQAAALEPAVTGTLHYLLTRGPERIRDVIVKIVPYLQDPEKLAKFVKILRWLLVLGIARKANMWLNDLAANHWQIKSQKQKWQWGNEVAVVTGGCSGIGLKIVEGLKKKGVKVAVVDIQGLPESLQNYRNVKFFQCDITNPSAFHDTAEAIRHTLGRPSILINNAGIGAPHTIQNTSPEYLSKIFNVNLLSHYTTVKEFLPDMVAKDKGHIVTIASMASFVAPGIIVDYAVTKAGAHAFHEGLTQEIRHVHRAPHVLTSVIHPNWVSTNMVSDYESEIKRLQGRLLRPDTVAQAVCDQVFSCRGAQVILPKHFAVVGGIRGWPLWLQEIVRDVTGAGARNPKLAAVAK